MLAGDCGATMADGRVAAGTERAPRRIEDGGGIKKIWGLQERG